MFAGLATGSVLDFIGVFALGFEVGNIDFVDEFAVERLLDGRAPEPSKSTRAS